MDHTTIEDIKTAVTALIGDDYTVNTDEQSFTRYPTNHINLLIGDNFHFEVGQIIYDEILIDQSIIEHLKDIISAAKKVLDFADIVCIGSCDDASYNITAEDLEGERYTVWATEASAIPDTITTLLNQLEAAQNEDD